MPKFDHWLKWESLYSDQFYVHRLKVPGGWLVYVHHEEAKALTGGSSVLENWVSHGGLTFYPDPSHQWNVAETQP